MLRVPPESSAPNFKHVSLWQALHWIYGVPQDSNEVSTSVGINKKRRTDAKGEMKTCKNDVLCYSYICYFILDMVILLFVPNSTHFFCSAGHMSVIPKRKIWRSSTYLFLGGCCTVPLFCVKTNHDTKLLEHFVPFWSALYHYRCRCSMLKFMVTGWSFVSTHPRHPGYFDSSKSSPWRVGPFNLSGSSINQWNEAIQSWGPLMTDFRLLGGSLDLRHTHGPYIIGMKLATTPRLSMQSLRCLDWFCSVIDCRKYPGVCRWMQVSENEGILLQISILF